MITAWLSLFDPTVILWALVSSISMGLGYRLLRHCEIDAAFEAGEIKRRGTGLTKAETARYEMALDRMWNWRAYLALEGIILIISLIQIINAIVPGFFSGPMAAVILVIMTIFRVFTFINLRRANFSRGRTDSLFAEAVREQYEAKS